MAVLSQEGRDKVLENFMVMISKERFALSLSKSDLMAAISMIDVWADANEDAVFAVIPEPASSELTDNHKICLYQLVFKERLPMDG